MSSENLPRNVTLRDIAGIVGLHYSTVSLALRDSPRLAPETRQRIQALARELGYRPDPMLTALNAYRRARVAPHYQATIAWVNNWPRRAMLYERPEFLEYFQGATARAEQLGYKLEEFWLREPGMTPAKLARVLRARTIQAVLLAPQFEPNTALDFDYADFAAIAFGYSLQPAVLSVVTNHQMHSVGLLLRRLLDLGYRRPGLCIPRDMDEKVESAYLSAFLLLAWKEPTLGQVPPLLFVDDRALEADTLLVDWLGTHRPDVVVSLSYLAERVERLGYAIPRDIGFATISIDVAEARWAGIYQNGRIIGGKAVDMAVGMLHRGERGVPEVPVRMLVEGTWRDGETVRRQG